MKKIFFVLLVSCLLFPYAVNAKRIDVHDRDAEFQKKDAEIAEMLKSTMNEESSQTSPKSDEQTQSKSSLYTLQRNGLYCTEGAHKDCYEIKENGEGNYTAYWGKGTSVIEWTQSGNDITIKVYEPDSVKKYTTEHGKIIDSSTFEIDGIEYVNIQEQKTPEAQSVDIEELMKTSTAFKDADKELNKVWKETYGAMPASPLKSALLEEQRNWIKSGRILSAQDYLNKGFSIEDAFVQATLERADALRENAKKQKQQGQDARQYTDQDRTIKEQNQNSEQVGPIINGLRLGMNKNDAIRRAKELGLTGKIDPNANIISFYKNNWEVLRIQSNKNNNLLCSILFYPQFFSNDQINIESFAQNFAQHFNLDLIGGLSYSQFLQRQYIEYIHENTKEGFKVIISSASITNLNPHIMTKMEFKTIDKISF